MSAQVFGTVLLRRACQIGQRRAEHAADRLAERITETIPGVTAQREGSIVRVSGRGLARRWITDAALRWLGRLLR